MNPTVAGMKGKTAALAALGGFLIVLLWLQAVAQQPPERGLRVASERPIMGASLPGTIISSPKCDSSGDIFVRPAISRISSLNAAAGVMSISANGYAGHRFSLDSVPGYMSADFVYVRDFAVTPSGGVDLSAVRCTAAYKCSDDVLLFDAEGAYRGTVTLRAGLHLEPHRLALLPNGSFLVVGFAGGRSSATPAASAAGALRPFVGVFSPSGQLRKEVSLPGDITVPPDGFADVSYVEAVQLTAVATDQTDGNVYLSRRSLEPVLYTIAGDGTVVNHVLIKPPFAGAVLHEIRYAGPEKVAMVFGRSVGEHQGDLSSAVYTLVDANTGRVLAEYQSTPQTGGLLGCYLPTGFEFVAPGQGGGMVIRHSVGP